MKIIVTSNENVAISELMAMGLTDSTAISYHIDLFGAELIVDESTQSTETEVMDEILTAPNPMEERQVAEAEIAIFEE